ncbi:MAG: outer membrane protein assembly factor BamA [Candidatus Omnitrophota bacterium]
MNTYKITKCIFVCLIAISCLFQAAVSSAQESSSVTDIVVAGNRTVSSDTILSRIKMRKGDVFLQKAVNEDIKRLYAMGFFMDVTAKAEQFNGGIRLIFSVVEKAVIKQIVFEGNKVFREKILVKQMSTNVDDVLNKRRLSEDVKSLKDFYRKKGYALSKVDFDVEINAETNNAVVYILIEEEARYRVKEIVFEGNFSFKDKRLLKIIATKAKGLLNSGYLDKETLDLDIERLQEFYKSEGFIEVVAAHKISFDVEKNAIILLITIDEGDKYYVGNVVIKGNSVIPKDVIQQEIKMKEGESYNATNLRMDLIGIQSLYFDKGYMSCKVKPNTVLNRDIKFIDVAYDIVEGSLSYVNEVKITGNTKTKDEVIRREIRLFPGEKYDGKKLRRSKQRLYDLGYFDEVLFETQDSTEASKKDLMVNVKETKTGEFSFGGGYSSVDKFVGFVEVNQRNFDIMQFPGFTGGGQNLKLRAELGSVRQNYLLSFTEPWILGYPYLFGFDLYNYARKKESGLGYGYGEKKTGGDLRFGKEFTDIDRADLIYRLENVKIEDVNANATTALKDEEGKNTISSLGLTITRNTTDSKFNPTEGYILTATTENAGGPLGGNKDFFKITGLADYFCNYQKKLVVELKLRAGLADEYDDSISVPIYERYFAGGANSVRGYKERSIGPRDAETADAVGGEAMFIGNFEVTYPILTNLKLAAFYDIGNVWEDTDDIATGDFKSSIGAGVRVKTPIGPVKLDMGYPLNEAHEEDEQKLRFHFSMAKGF